MLINYEIRPFKEQDYHAIEAIESSCFVAPWNKDNLMYELHENKYANFYVLEVDNKVVGFYDYWVTFDSATICQIAIIPEYRGRGLAKIMMQEIIDDCYAKRVNTITLEVRENNEKARRLYEKMGFLALLVKPNYYSNGDNAIYMIREVKQDA